VEVDFKLSGLDRLVLALDAKLTKKVVNRTLNNLIDRGTTAGKKKVREKYNIKAKNLGRYIKGKKSNPNSLEASISVNTRTVSLFNFINAGNIKSKLGATRRGRTPVKVKIIRTAGAHKLSHAFVMIGKGGNIGIFENVRGVKTSSGKNKIKRLNTVGPSKMFESEGVPIMQKYIDDNAARIFKQNFNFYIRSK